MEGWGPVWKDEDEYGRMGWGPVWKDGMGISMEGWGPVWKDGLGTGRMGWGPVKSKPCESEPAVSFGGGWEGVASFGRGVALARRRGVGTASSDPVVLP